MRSTRARLACRASRSKRGSEARMSPSPNSVVAVTFPGEEAPPERTERDEADPELLEGGQDRLLGLAPEQGVLALQRRDGLYGVGAPDGADSGLGQAEVVHLAGLDELLDRAGDVLDGDVGVDPVLVEQVDGVGAQSSQGAVDGGADVVGPARDARLGAVLVEGEAELGGDDDVVADRLQCLADELLVVERAVDLGGVEEGDAAVDRSAQERDHLVPWGSRAEGLAHAHAAEAEGGDLEASGAESACLHAGSPWSCSWRWTCGMFLTP